MSHFCNKLVNLVIIVYVTHFLSVFSAKDGTFFILQPQMYKLRSRHNPLTECACRVPVRTHAVPLGQRTVRNKDKTPGFS